MHATFLSRPRENFKGEFTMVVAKEEGVGGCESVMRRRRGGRAEADSIMIIPRMKFTADHHARRAGNVEGAR